nr:basic 7S globulin 2-like [Tanacetum cinerariifolium]
MRSSAQRHTLPLCLPSNSSASGVLFFGTGPYYLLPNSNVDVRSLLSNTSLIRYPDSFGYYIGVTGNSTTKLSTIEPYTTLRTDIYNRVIRTFSLAIIGIPRVSPVAPFAFVIRRSSTAPESEHEGPILFGLPGSLQQKFLVLRFFDIKEQQGIDRRLEDKQPEEKTNTDCLVNEQEKEYQTRWKIKTGNVLDSCNQRSIQQYKKSRVAKHLGVAGIQQQNGLVDETNVTFFAKPIDMLGIFGWLASIKKGMLEPVKVKCIFLVYHKNIVGNKLWRLDDVTLKVVLYRNMGFNESEEYKKTFIGSGVGTGLMQVLHGFKFEVEPLGDHTYEVEPQENVDQGAGLQEVQTQDLIYYHLARDREQHLACELFGYREDINESAFAVVVVEKIYAHESPTFNNTVSCKVISKWKAGMEDDMDAWLDVYVLSNSCRKCSDDNNGFKAEIWATKDLLDKAKGNVLGMEIVRDRSRKILRVSQSGYISKILNNFRIDNGKSVQMPLGGHFKLSLKDCPIRDCDVERMSKVPT